MPFGARPGCDVVKAEEDGFGVTLHIFFGWISKSNYVLDLGMKLFK